MKQAVDKQESEEIRESLTVVGCRFSNSGGVQEELAFSRSYLETEDVGGLILASVYFV